jgi:NAD(P)-dependent dehydrogenase (short-subunit alcohol dehydrogenase family)
MAGAEGFAMGRNHVVITGAAGALGGAVCAHLAEAGWPVVAVDHSSHKLPECAVAGYRADLTLEAEASRIFAKIGQAAPGLAGLVNIAGGFAWETISDGSADTWDRLNRLNVKTALNACRAALPFLADGASIVNIGAAAAAKADAGMGPYAAAKAGVARLTEALAAELKPRIRVNAVLPSIIDTPANRADMPAADTSKWVTPAELAAVIAFLLSPAASGVSGASIPVVGRV